MPVETIALGRWRVRHQHNECDYYIHNLHCDPGYSVAVIEEKREKMKAEGIFKPEDN
jgi:hypothetical protein